MNECDAADRIVDPNRAERMAAPWLMLFFFAAGVVMAVLDGNLLPVGALIVLVGFPVAAIIAANRPYVVLTPAGVRVRFLFRDRIYAWPEILQTGIRRGTAAKAGVEYKYPVVILLPGGSARMGAWDPRFVERNLFRLVILPNRPEIRDHIRRYYGCLDFDDTEK